MATIFKLVKPWADFDFLDEDKRIKKHPELQAFFDTREAIYEACVEGDEIFVFQANEEGEEELQFVEVVEEREPERMILRSGETRLFITKWEGHWFDADIL